MKKLILTTLLCLLAFNFYAQRMPSFGVRAGANIANITGDDVDDLSSRTGVYFGFLAEFGMTDLLAIQPELNFSMQGAEYSEEGEEEKFKLNYLNIPVNLKVNVTDGLYFEAGPQLGFLMSANAEFDDGFESGEEDIKDEIKDIDFSGNVGLGYTLDNGLFFNARYNFGLSNINDFEGGEDLKNQNAVISLGIGWML